MCRILSGGEEKFETILAIKSDRKVFSLHRKEVINIIQARGAAIRRPLGQDSRVAQRGDARSRKRVAGLFFSFFFLFFLGRGDDACFRIACAAVKIGASPKGATRVPENVLLVCFFHFFPFFF